MKIAAAFAAGALLGAVLTVTEPVEGRPATPIAEVILASCLNGGFIVDGEIWICTPTGDKTGDTK